MTLRSRRVERKSQSTMRSFVASVSERVIPARASHATGPVISADRSPEATTADERLANLHALEQKVLWLSVWMIHHANHLRPRASDLKVGGHQASSASVVTLMTALYLDALNPTDRVAVKPHASPVFHAIQYLLGRQTRDKLERFRAYGGAQSYPSRTKDTDDVDFSTGSVGLGVAMTSFAALVQDYVRARGLVAGDTPPGRMIALLGDAEFDEGNVFEAMLEGWKHDIRHVWWIVDYNRQSLDVVTPDRLFHRTDAIFRSMEWNVVTLKFGRRRTDVRTTRRRRVRGLDRRLPERTVFGAGASRRQCLACAAQRRPGRDGRHHRTAR